MKKSRAKAMLQQHSNEQHLQPESSAASPLSTQQVAHSTSSSSACAMCANTRTAISSSSAGRDGSAREGLRNVAASERGVAAGRMGSRDAGWPLLPEETRGRDGSALYRSEVEGSRS